MKSLDYPEVDVTYLLCSIFAAQEEEVHLLIGGEGAFLKKFYFC